MARLESSPLSPKAIIFVLFASLIATSTTSSRILIDSDEPAPDSADTPIPSVSPLVTNNAGDDHPLTFFMHDILGGSNPTARAVTGVVTNPALNAQVAFAEPNGANLPLNNGLPQNNQNEGFLNNNNLPFLTGLSGNPGNVISNNNNGGAGFPVTNVNLVPAGMTLQKLMFGTMTVFDDELTEGHEIGSGLVGKAQGFYIASAEDGTGQVLAFTAMFKESGYADSISFLGVHRTDRVSESQLAVIGGTGKYLNAQGFAISKTFPVTDNDQHSTDGVETLLQLTVYLTY